MKLCLIAAASVLATHCALAEPFSQTTVATKIHYQSVQYNLKNNHTLKGIKVPVVNRPVRMMVTDVTPYDPGVGEATLMATSGTTMQWIGNDTWSANNGKPVYGGSQGPGTHLMWVNYDGTVDIEVQNQQTLQIRNKSGGPQEVIITFIW